MVVSLYINKNNTQISVLERITDYFELKYINTFAPINLEDMAATSNNDILQKISSVLSEYSIDNFFVTISSDYYIQTYIPITPASTTDDINKLLNFEISQYFPDKSISDFRYKINLLEQQNMSLAILISKDIINATEMLVATLGYEMTDINPAPFSEINAFSYNYIDVIENFILIVQINKEEIAEYILLQNNKIIGYELAHFDLSKNIDTQLENKIVNIREQHNVSDLKGIYFFGDALTKQLYLDCWKIGLILSGDSKRFNPFRMLHSEFDRRDKDYIARTFQQYVQCIGGGLPTQISVLRN